MDKWLSIQALRGVALIGIVAFHSMSIMEKYSGGSLLLPDVLTLGRAGPDLFFVISGFVMMSVTTSRFAGEKTILRFLWGRFTRIYPTYWFYFSLMVAILSIKPDWVHSPQVQQAELVSSFLLFPSYLPPVVLVAWSLIHEVWFYFIFALLLRLNESWMLPCLLVWGAIVATANSFVAFADLSPGLRIAIHPYTLEFIIGALVWIFISSKYSRMFTSRMYFVVLTVMLAAGVPLVYRFDVLREVTMSRVLVIGALDGFLVLALAALERERKLFVPRFLNFIGDISYTIYLSHLLILVAIGRLWGMVRPAHASLLDNMLAYLIMVAAVVGYGWLGYRLVEQPILRASHRLRTRWFDQPRSLLSPAVNSEAVR